METIGSRIRYARESLLKVSQKELADLIGVSQPSLAYIESGVTKNPRKIEKFAKVLGVPKDWLLVGGELNPSSSIKNLEEDSELTQLKHRVKLLECYILGKKDSF